MIDAPVDFDLLNAFQRDFPLVVRPFEAVARRVGSSEQAVIAAYRAYRASGALSRIGAVWSRGAGGAGALCAMRVPSADLDRVARIVNDEIAVNHNYQREHEWNLWYVITAGSAGEVREVATRIEDAAGCPALFLPMLRPYRVDLGFDLRDGRSRKLESDPICVPVADGDRPLAALAERGLSLVQRPYDLWAAALGRSTADVLATLQRWQAGYTVRRFGVVVRHHDLGFNANAMTVAQVPEEQVDAIGAALAAQPDVSLAYRRVADPRWPYNLYFMVHGRERAEAEGAVALALAASGAGAFPHETLFSLRRYKQTGGHYFTRDRVASEATT